MFRYWCYTIEKEGELMNMESALPRRKAAFCPVQVTPRRARVREKDRDPYDGLRPWG